MRTPCRISSFVQGAQVSPSLSISFIIHSYRNWWQPPEFKFSWNRLNSFFGLDCARPKTVPMRPTHMGTRRALILAWALFPVHANSSPYFFPDMPYPRLIRWVQAYPFSRLLWRGVVWAGTSGCWPSGAPFLMAPLVTEALPRAGREDTIQIQGLLSIPLHA